MSNTNEILFLFYFYLVFLVYLNLCEQTITNALGLALIRKNVRTLHLGHEEQAEILEMMQNRSCGKLVQVPCCKVCTEDEYEHLKKDAAKSLQM